MKSFSHIAILVNDLDRMEEFYHKVFSMKTAWKNDEKAYLTTGNNDILALLVDQEFRNKPYDLGKVTEDQELTPNFFHFGMVVNSEKEFKEMLDKCRAIGLEVVGPKTSRDTTRSFYFSDPENYLIQIVFPPREYFSQDDER